LADDFKSVISQNLKNAPLVEGKNNSTKRMDLLNSTINESSKNLAFKIPTQMEEIKELSCSSENGEISEEAKRRNMGA
jgi:hypothetical protein